MDFTCFPLSAFVTAVFLVMLLAENVSLFLHFLPFVWYVEAGGTEKRKNAMQEQMLLFEESPKKHKHRVWA